MRLFSRGQNENALPYLSLFTRSTFRITNYCGQQTGITCLSFDVHSFLNEIVDQPQSYGFISATAFCPDYANETGTQPSYADSEACEPLPSYIWWDDLHVTWPVHKILGSEISELLKKA